DVPRLPRLQDREHPACPRHRALARAVRGRAREGDRVDDRRRAPGRDPADASAAHGPQHGPVRRAGRDLRRARARPGDPPAARLSGARGLGGLDRGDGSPHHPPRRPAPRGGPGVLKASSKEPVPLWRWATWWLVLVLALFVFYVLFAPVWIGLRGAAWVA